MKVDTYTKTVLTVIAISLVYLCFKNVSFSETVAAQGPSRQEVIIAGVKTADGFLPVKISGTAPSAKLNVAITDVTRSDHALPVIIWGVNTSNKLLPVSINSPTAPLPVSIESIKKDSRSWDTLSVKTVSDPK